MRPVNNPHETVNFQGMYDYLRLGCKDLGPNDIGTLIALDNQMESNPGVISQMNRGDANAEIADLYFDRGDVNNASKHIEKAIDLNSWLIESGKLDLNYSFCLSRNNLAFYARQLLYQGTPVGQVRHSYTSWLKDLLSEVANTKSVVDFKQYDKNTTNQMKGVITELCLLILVSDIDTEEGPVIGLPSFRRQDESYGHSTPWDVAARQYTPQNLLTSTQRLQAKTSYIEQFAPEDEGEIIFIYGDAHMQFGEHGNARGLVTALLEEYPTQTQQKIVDLAKRNIQDEIEARAA